MVFFLDYTTLSPLCLHVILMFCSLFSQIKIYIYVLLVFLLHFLMPFKIFKFLKLFFFFFFLTAVFLLFGYLCIYLTNLLAFSSLLMTSYNLNEPLCSH